MALIDRIIYPIINKEITEIELLNNYTPSNQEIQFAKIDGKIIKTGNLWI